jgi:hypothetical protein
MTIPLFVLGLLVVYLVIGFRLSAQASRFLKDRQKLYTSSPLVQPELYSAEGDAARVRALRFWWAGGAVLLATVALAAYVTR